MFLFDLNPVRARDNITFGISREYLVYKFTFDRHVQLQLLQIETLDEIQLIRPRIMITS